MVDKVIITKYDDVYLKVHCEPGIAMELKEYFKFEVPGAKWTPAYKSRMWDGHIYLFNALTGLIYLGLHKYIEEFCRARSYEFEAGSEFSSFQFSLKEAEEFVEKLKLPFKPHEHQMEAFVHAVRERRGLLISPTASGKSLIIYMIMAFYMACLEKARVLIIVPTVSLVSQLTTDFKSYGFSAYDAAIHKITAGEEKYTKKPITISTWQSIYKMPKKYFDQFDVVIGDEAHLFKAKSLTSILSKMTQCEFRFGLTGTLDGTETHKLVLEGLFGAVRKVISTDELMAKKLVAELNIKCIVLKYNDIDCMSVTKLDYQNEMKWLVGHEKRNKFIRNLTSSLKGNTLVLFQLVEKHGKPLYETLKKENPDRKIFYVYGGVSGDEREEIRKIIESESNAIIVASYGTFSTGINIKNLHNVIFSSPYKSQVKVLQSIGRALRISAQKAEATLFDISDDLTWKSDKNTTLLHFMERLKIYNKERFKYKLYKVSID